jgi:hypothetical protein
MKNDVKMIAGFSLTKRKKHAMKMFLKDTNYNI